jgi:integrase
LLPNGQRKEFYGKTRKEVAERLRLATNTVKSGLPLPSGTETVATFTERWIRDVAPLRVRSNTLLRYRKDVKNHILPRLGRLKLTELTPGVLQAWISELAAEGLSPNSIRHLRAVLRVILGQAQIEGIIPQNNAKLVKTPRIVERKVAALGPDDAKKLLSVFENTDLGPMVTLALAIGVRQGEILGLSWNDVDLEQGILHIHQQLQRIDGEYVLVELNTAKSQRTLSVPEFALNALREQRRQQLEWKLRAGQSWIDTGLVFTTPAGYYINGPSLTHQFEKRLSAAGVPVMRFHDLRHGAASLLLAQGADLKRIQAQLGHSSITLTSNTYAHISAAVLKDNADLMQKALGG